MSSVYYIHLCENQGNCYKQKKTGKLDLKYVHTGLANTIDAEIYVGENVHGWCFEGIYFCGAGTLMENKTIEKLLVTG